MAEGAFYSTLGHFYIEAIRPSLALPHTHNLTRFPH
jgi:hypothetical protein